jgi:hypothetical protein
VVHSLVSARSNALFLS